MHALDGMRILDMTQYEAGTSCTMMLGWLGADVVKIESPQGDPGRRTFGHGTPDSQYFLNYNTNKRSVVIDLQRPRGRELFLELAPHFDAFVENYGPGVMERLGLDYETVSAVHPRLIYARIKGFGLSGPYAGYKSFDPLAQAASGVFSVTGEPDGPPMRPGGTFADTGTGMQTALAIVAAYVQRQTTGRGQHIEISMQEVMTMFMRTAAVPSWGGGVVQRRGNRQGPPAGTYPCAPGGPNDYVHMLPATSRQWDTLCVAIGRPELADDPRFATGSARAEHADEIVGIVTEWTRRHTKHEAMRLLGEAGVPASAVFDTVDLFADPHLNERGFIEHIAHPVEGDVTLLGSPIRMSDSPVEFRRPPLLGEHADEVLGELGWSADAIAALRAEGVLGGTPESDAAGGS